MKVGDLIRSRHKPFWVGLITQMMLDGKHFRFLCRGSYIIGEIRHFEVIHASR